jgi:hypothetical protein
LANLNKENIITVDVKNATVSTQGNMTFYATDENTCNIYCQLVINKSKSALIKKFAPIENAINYKVILRAIQPIEVATDVIELEFTLLNELEAFFMVDLKDEFVDYIGDYKCELFVECEVDGRIERITTSPFTYKVNGSIKNDLLPDNSGISQSFLENVATKAYVARQIAEIPETDLLNDYATVSLVDESISQYDSEISNQNYATREDLNNIVNDIRYDLFSAGYTTDAYVNEEILNLSNSIMSMNYATESYVKDEIAKAQLDGSVDLSLYATKTYVNDEIVKISNGIASMNFVTENQMNLAIKDYVDEHVSNNGGTGGSVDTDNLAITNSLTVGIDCTASGVGSVAHGVGCDARGDYSHAEGQATIAVNTASHAEGMECYTYGDYSHAEGYWTITYSDYQHVQGRFNIFDENNKYAHIVGNGNGGDESNGWQPMRSNAHTLDWDGNAWYAKDVYVGGTSQDDANKLATESYVDNAINNIEIPDVDLTDYATKDYVYFYVSEVLGDIETLLGEI